MTTGNDEVFEPLSSEDEDVEFSIPIYRIRSYPSDPDLETLYGRWKRQDLLIPGFQRRYVWKPQQASKLIESFLMGLPVPEVFVLVQNSDLGQAAQRQLVIDGQQRLLSVFGFIEGKYPDGQAFQMKGVGQRWEGKAYEDLDDSEQRALQQSVLRVINIDQAGMKGANATVREIFQRLNTGGTILTQQEIRNSLYQGRFNTMLVECNDNPDWRRVFGAPLTDPRMRDVELIARFLSLHERASEYAKPMKTFIDNFMEAHQHDEDIARFQSAFANCVHSVYECLGEKPFHIKRGINVAVFDAVMVAFAQATAIPSNVRLRYQDLKNNRKFSEATTAATTDVDTVQARLKIAKEVLFE